MDTFAGALFVTLNLYSLQVVVVHAFPAELSTLIPISVMPLAASPTDSVSLLFLLLPSLHPGPLDYQTRTFRNHLLQSTVRT